MLRVLLVLSLLVFVPAVIVFWRTRQRGAKRERTPLLRTLLIWWSGVLALSLTWAAVSPAVAQEDQLAYAVVSEAPKDKSKVSAKIALDGAVSDTKLLATETILYNPIWKKLEVCHAMKLEGQRTSEGFRVNSVRAIDASLLPMILQGFAGDCLLKKALEVAPLTD